MFFLLPAVPAELTQPAERAEYVVCHYWDSVDWRDVTDTDTPVIEGAFADYATVLPLLPADKRAEALSGWLADVHSGSNASWEMVRRLGRIYLYGYDSPVYDTEIYFDFAEAATALDSSDARMVEDVRDLAANCPGAPGSDLCLIDRTGEETTLYSMIGDTSPEGVMLIFYSPDCRDCHELRDRLQQNPPAENIIAVYAGEDTEAWQRDLQSWPATWSVTRACEGDEVPYLIRRTPTIYRLNAKGVVISREL